MSKKTQYPAIDSPVGGKSGSYSEREGRSRPSDIYFFSADLAQGLGRRAARGGLYTFASVAVSFLITTVSTVLITRELSDEDFGLYGMVAVLTGFSGLFIDLGLSRAVIQKPQITRSQVSSLFWLNLAIATVIALVTALLTPALVWFYDEERLVTINLSLAGLYLVSALGIQHRALLIRRMEFGRLSLINVLSLLGASLVAVGVAFGGGGYWALVALPAALQLFTTAGVWFCCRWLPGLPRRGTGVRGMLAFGGNVTGFQFINYFARNADNAMLGAAWGAGPLGLYTRAYSLMMMPATRLTAPLDKVVFPALSRLTDKPAAYRAAYRKIVRISATLATFPTVGVVLVAPELIPWLLGEQWAGIVPIFLALSPAVIVACTNSASSWLYMTVGHVDKQLRYGAANAALMVGAMFAGLPWGPLGVALAVSLSRVILKLPYVWLSCRGTPVTLMDYVRSAGLPTLLALGPAVVVYIVAGWVTFLLDGGAGRSFAASLVQAATAESLAVAMGVVFAKITAWLLVVVLFSLLSPVTRGMWGEMRETVRWFRPGAKTD